LADAARFASTGIGVTEVDDRIVVDY